MIIELNHQKKDTLSLNTELLSRNISQNLFSTKTLVNGFAVQSQYSDWMFTTPERQHAEIMRIILHITYF